MIWICVSNGAALIDANATIVRCGAVRAVLREVEAEAAVRQAIGAPLEVYAASI